MLVERGFYLHGARRVGERPDGEKPITAVSAAAKSARLNRHGGIGPVESVRWYWSGYGAARSVTFPGGATTRTGGVRHRISGPRPIPPSPVAGRDGLQQVRTGSGKGARWGKRRQQALESGGGGRK